MRSWKRAAFAGRLRNLKNSVLQFAATLLNLMENWLRLLFSRDALRLNDRVATLAETGPE